MLLSREAILNASDTTLDLQTVAVPEWGGEVKIRVMTGKQREGFEQAVNTRSAECTLRARLAAICICDEAGRALFTPADVEALGNKSSRALQRVYDAALAHNAIGKKGIDEAEKNSERATSGATPSDSPGATESSTSTD